MFIDKKACSNYATYFTLRGYIVVSLGRFLLFTNLVPALTVFRVFFSQLLTIYAYNMLHYILSQVGIIMYLPTADPRQRKDITDEFFHYRHLTQTQLWDQYSAYEHWAKIEVIVDS